MSPRSHPGAQSEGSLNATPLRFPLKCKCRLHEAIVQTVVHTWQHHQSLRMAFPNSSREREAAILTWGFCVCLLVFVGMSERLRLSRRPYCFFLLSPLKKKKKRWDLHRPVFENSPQPQAGGLRQSDPTAAGNALLAGSHHLRQWGRHTVRSWRRWGATFGFLITEPRLLESGLRPRYGVHARQTHLWQKQI